MCICRTASTHAKKDTMSTTMSAARVGRRLRVAGNAQRARTGDGSGNGVARGARATRRGARHAAARETPAPQNARRRNVTPRAAEHR